MAVMNKCDNGGGMLDSLRSDSHTCPRVYEEGCDETPCPLKQVPEGRRPRWFDCSSGRVLVAAKVAVAEVHRNSLKRLFF